MRSLQRRQPAAICLLAAIGLLTLAGALSGCGGAPPGGPAPGNEAGTQATFEALIVEDRLELMTGQLDYYAPRTITVGTSDSLTVKLQAILSSTPMQADPTQPHITLLVGGVEGASLTAVTGSVTVTRVGPATGLIAQPGDTVWWTWNLAPQQPGPIVLDLVVATYRGDTSEPLYTLNPPLAIHLVAVNTIGNQAKAVGTGIASFITIIGSAAAAMLAVTGCIAGTVRWRRRRVKRRQKAARTAPNDATERPNGQYSSSAYDNRGLPPPPQGYQ